MSTMGFSGTTDKLAPPASLKFQFVILKMQVWVTGEKPRSVDLVDFTEPAGELVELASKVNFGKS